MLSISDLEQAIQAYRSREVSLDQFADWFEDASLSVSDSALEVHDACMRIDEALSALRLGEIKRDQLLGELANAVRPFASAVPDRAVVRVPAGAVVLAEHNAVPGKSSQGHGALVFRPELSYARVVDQGPSLSSTFRGLKLRAVAA